MYGELERIRWTVPAHQTDRRLSVGVLAVFTALIGPWWVALGIALLHSAIFGGFEMLTIGVILDALYHTDPVHGLTDAPIFTLIIGAVCIGARVVRKRLR